MKTRLSLRRLIIGVMLTLSLTIVLAPPLLDLRNGLQRSEARSEQHLVELMGHIVADLERANRSSATHLPANYLRTLTRYRTVDGALVVDPANNIAQATNFATRGANIRDTEFAEYAPRIAEARRNRVDNIVRSGNHLIGIASIAWRLQPGELLPSRSGALVIRYDMSEDIAAAQRDAARTAGTLVAAVALFTALATWFFQRIIGRDVHTLERIAEAVAGRREVDTPAVRLYEFAQIGAALERTREIIHEQIRSLETSEDRFRDIVESSHEWIFEADDTWRLIYSNGALKEMLGYSVEEVIGRPLADFLEETEDNRRQFGLMTTSERFQEIVVHLLDSGGQPRLLRFSGYRRSATPATAAATRGVASDITAQSRMEKALVQSQKLDAVGQLAGGIAHDFNNVLAAILSRCEMLIRNCDLDEAVAGQVRDIEYQALGASQLTKRLMTISRQDTAAPRLLEINEAVRRAGRLLESGAGAQITLRYDLNPAPMNVQFDPVQLEQILLNLTINAKNAMPAGGSIEISTRRVSHHSELGGTQQRFVELRFADTGTGIDPAIRDHIFEPFFTTSERGDGMGLGLASVETNLRAAGGSIRVESPKGRGATFVILLPERVGDARPVEKPVNAQAPRGDGARILIVDDMHEMRTIIGQFLRGKGYDVTEADGVSAAVECMAASQFDLVISDVQLKDGNGIEMIAGLESPPKTIYMSGYIRPESAARVTLEAGRNFIHKPFRLGELANLVHHAVHTASDAPGITRLAGNGDRQPAVPAR